MLSLLRNSWNLETMSLYVSCQSWLHLATSPFSLLFTSKRKILKLCSGQSWRISYPDTNKLNLWYILFHHFGKCQKFSRNRNKKRRLSFSLQSIWLIKIVLLISDNLIYIIYLKLYCVDSKSRLDYKFQKHCATTFLVRGS